MFLQNHSSSEGVSVHEKGSEVSWRADWAWGLPLVVMTAVIHVIGLGLIRQRGVPMVSSWMEGRHHTVVFGVIVGATTLLATCLHGIEAGIWAAAYRLLGALPDGPTAMLYSLSAMTAYGHANLFLETRWQLMGALEALNGWLLFGLTTAFLFGIVKKVWF
jgi:hypothetical protein